MLDFSALESAFLQLKEHYHLAKEEQNSIRKFAFKTATIKSFEYTYEIIFKMLKRVMENSAASDDEFDHLNFRQLLRISAEAGLIEDPKTWFFFREKRNITSHTYDEKKADDIFNIIPDFIKEAGKLLISLKQQDVS